MGRTVGFIAGIGFALVTPNSLAATRIPGAVRDAVLDDAAARHADAVLADERRATLEEVERALGAVGVADPHVIPFAAIGRGASLENALAAFVADHVLYRGVTHFGRAERSEGDKTALVAIFQRRLVDLPPLPARPPPEGIGIRGRSLVEGPIRGYLSAPNGAVTRLPVRRLADRFELAVHFPSGPGRYVFELVADTDRGPEVAALWRFRVGADASPEPDPDAQLRLPEVSASLELLIARARSRASLGPLVRDPRLDAAARAHAKQICELGLAVHVVPGGETTRERVRAHGYGGPVTENVALAPTLHAAHANLLESPSHRANVLDPGVRSLGLGLATRTGRSGRSVCVVQLFGATDR